MGADIASRSHDDRALLSASAFSLHRAPAEAKTVQSRAEFNIDDAIVEIAVLLADAYRRRARLLPASPGTPPSTGELAIKGHRSVHELTLTRRREVPRT